MFKRIDRSSFLLKTLERISALVANYRGVPVVFGIGLFVVGFILEVVNIFAGNQFVEVLQVVLRNGGILFALIGFVLIEPLGD